MIGYVFGNKEIADDISRIKYAGDEQLLFESSDGFTRISSSKVSIRHTASFGGPNDDFPHGLLGVACQFECLELHEQVSLDAKAQTREITFMLHGPRSLWGNYSIRGLDYTGAVTIEQRGRTLRFKDLKFSVTPRDHYVYASRLECASATMSIFGAAGSPATDLTPYSPNVRWKYKRRWGLTAGDPCFQARS